MSYIPDIRNPKIETLYKNTEGAKDIDGKENPYFQGYLDDKSAEFLAGYDWAIEKIFDSFFYNLDIYADELDEVGFDDVRIKNFDKFYVDFLEKEYTDSPIEIDSIKDSKIALILAIYRAFKDYAEGERDELGVSMIESMSEADYKASRERYKAGYKNAVLRLQEELFE